jgi:hypothetical protein
MPDYFMFGIPALIYDFQHHIARVTPSAAVYGGGVAEEIQIANFLILNPVPEHICTGLCPLIPVLDWLQHQHFCSYRYRTDWMSDRPTFRHLKRGYTLHVHTAGFGGCDVVAHHLFLLCFPPRPSRDLLFLTHVVHM